MKATKASRASSSRPTRTYTSPRRQKQAADTKAAVLDAAQALFSERGWTGTSMRDVAGHAEVSVETLYALYGSKPDLFQAALTAAVRGDLRPVPIAERPEFLAQAQGTTQDRIRASTRLISRTHRDAAGLHRALREAAASDPNLGRLLAENEERRKADIALGFELINGRRPTPTERDAVWTLLSFEVYDLLVERSGWSLRRYEDWLATLPYLSGPETTATEKGRPKSHQRVGTSGREGGTT